MTTRDIDLLLERFRAGEELDRGTLAGMVGTLDLKRKRKHIRNYVLDEALATQSLEDRARLIVGGLGDEFSEMDSGYEFGFDSVGLYKPDEDGNLVLVSSNGEVQEMIVAGEGAALYREHIERVEGAADPEEFIMPLVVGDDKYVGAIVVSNKDSGRTIDIGELYDFLHSYADFAALALNSAAAHAELEVQYERVRELNHLLEGVIFMVTHDFKTPVWRVGNFASTMAGRLSYVEDAFEGVAEDIQLIRRGLEQALIGLSDSESVGVESAEIQGYLERLSGMYDSIQDAISGNPTKSIERLKSMVGVISDAAIEMEGEIEDLLTYQRALNEGMDLPESRYNPMEGMYRRLAKSQTIQQKNEMGVNTSTVGNGREITTSGGMADYLLGNVLSNALTYGEKGTTVDITVDYAPERYGGEGVEVVVTNYGQIDVDEFWKPGGSTRHGQGGTGFGSEIIKRTSARLSVEVDVRNTVVDDQNRVEFKLYFPETLGS